MDSTGEKVAASNARSRILERLKEVQKLDPPVEYKFTMRDVWSKKLFLALLRRYGIKPYRYYRQSRPKRYQCPYCRGKPTTTQRLSWHELRSPNTKPYEKWLLRWLVNSTVVDVANKLDISEETVTGVLDRWVATKVNWDKFQRIEILGIDEIALFAGTPRLCSSNHNPLNTSRS